MIWNPRLLMITNAYQPRFEISDYCNGGVLWTRGLSILQLVVLEGRWDTVVQCVW